MEKEKLMEDEAKKQKERNNEVGGQNFTPPHSLTQQKLSQLNVNLSPPPPLKKNSNFRFHGQNSKVQNFRFQIKNFLVPKS